MKKKLLLFSYSCFSDTGANGITMKNLLSAWSAEEKAEFYCEPKAPDFHAAHYYFRVTDVQAIKSFFGKKSRHIFNWSVGEEAGREVQAHQKEGPGKRPEWLRKYKYNFVLKWIREYAWVLGPWDKASFWEWLDAFSPDVIFYMVGESVFMDQLVLRVCEKTSLPLVLYNSEAFRLIDLRQRKGLERIYYRKNRQLYEKLTARASLVVYNSDMLKVEYEKQYPLSAEGIVAYNGAEVIETPYEPQEDAVNITYFGNLGVGRAETLLQVSDVLENVDKTAKLNIYGNATQEQIAQFSARDNILFHGFVDARRLREVILQADILLHVESFDEKLIPKMRYAFSTKIAQCLCAGRAFISFAPMEIASSYYLHDAEGALLVSDKEALEEMLRKLITDLDFRESCAQKAYQTGMSNHRTEVFAQALRTELEKYEN